MATLVIFIFIFNLGNGFLLVKAQTAAVKEFDRKLSRFEAELSGAPDIEAAKKIIFGSGLSLEDFQRALEAASSEELTPKEKAAIRELERLTDEYNKSQITQQQITQQQYEQSIFNLKDLPWYIKAYIVFSGIVVASKLSKEVALKLIPGLNNFFENRNFARQYEQMKRFYDFAKARQLTEMVSEAERSRAFVRPPRRLSGPAKPSWLSKLGRFGKGLKLLGKAVGVVGAVTAPPLVALDLKNCQELNNEVRVIRNRWGLILLDLENFPERREEIIANLNTVKEQIKSLELDMFLTSCFLQPGFDRTKDDFFKIPKIKSPKEREAELWQEEQKKIQEFVEYLRINGLKPKTRR